MKWLGVDVGGTFTDLVLYDQESGELAVEKVPSTPDDPSDGILAGIDRLGVDMRGVGKVAHGTTIATNTVLERRGARTSVLTTRGFRDVLEVGRGNRTRLYNIKATRPPPLVARSRVHEVDERALFDGTLQREVDPREIEAIAERLREAETEAVAVCFLHAYANGANEREAVRLLRQALPEAVICASAEVLPEYREYERFSTTALNAYVAPRVRRYLSALRDRLADRGYDRTVAIMTSNGGAWPLETVADAPVNTMFSGPAAGVIAADQVARSAGYANLITCDMGGTSTDTCLIRDGELVMSTDGRIEAFPNRVRQIEISSIGAGASSVAALEAGRFLRVGPDSAGAVPGPACYGRGGTAPTVTDANVVLGRLGSDRLLGGEIRLDTAAARRAVGELADRLGVDGIERMAAGIVDLAVTKMTSSIKEISIMRGHDPRDFVLFAYGGAGPLHAALVAAELGAPQVLVPPLPGNFSAFGLLVADVRHDLVRTRVVPTAGLAFEDLAATVAEMRDEGASLLAGEGFDADAMRFEATLDMRYVGQAFELSVPLAEDVADMDGVEAAFRKVYDKRYAYATDDPVEIVNVRLAAYGLVEKPGLPRAAAGRELSQARVGERPVVFDGDASPTPVYDRQLLPAKVELAGPALVEEPGSTTLVPAGFRAWIDGLGNLVLQHD